VSQILTLAAHLPSLMNQSSRSPTTALELMELATSRSALNAMENSCLKKI
jgi:hypothetical protein